MRSAKAWRWGQRRATSYMVSCEPVSSMSKPGSGDAKTRSYRGVLFVGVLLRGDQVDEGDAPVLVRLTERYASIQEAAA